MNVVYELSRILKILPRAEIKKEFLTFKKIVYLPLFFSDSWKHKLYVNKAYNTLLANLIYIVVENDYPTKNF